jgi:hypothetical protein
LTATVADGVSAEPSGTVTFKDGSTVLGSPTLSGGTATLQIATLTVGGHSLTASYSGDNSFAGSTSPARAHIVNEGATTVALVVSPAPARPRQTVSLSATVSVKAPAKGNPTGNVVFRNGTTVLGTQALSSGRRATITTTALTIGSHAITATYSGDNTFTGATGNATATVDPKVGPEMRVNTRTTDSQQLPAAAKYYGGYVAVWASKNQDGSDFGIYGQRYSTTGAKIGGEFKVNTRTAGIQSAPAVASLLDGGFVVVWESNGQDGSGYGIYAQRYTRTGAKIAGEFKVNTTTSNNQRMPAIANLGSGFVVVWASQQNGSGYDVHAQRFDKAGNPLGTEFKVNATTAKDQRAPSVVTLADTVSGFVVIWESDSQDGSGLGIYGRRFSRAGQPGSEFKVNAVTANAQSQPAVGAAGSGFVVAWQSAGQDGSGLGIYAQRYSSFGSRMGNTVLVNTTKLNDQSQPVIGSFTYGGGFVIAWTSNDGSGTGIFGQAFRHTGDRVDVEFRLNTTHLNEQNQPALAAWTSGRFFGAWTSRNQDGALEGVYGQLFQFNGMQ